MIQIRHSIFETNSSSTHALVYRASSRTAVVREPDKNYNVNLYGFYGDDEKNGILAVWFGTYNWDGDPCKHFRTKLAYLLTQAVSGWNFTYNDRVTDTEIKIKTQKDWDNVIENYVMKQPEIVRILDFIKEKCPNIKGFKFYWYNPQDDWELEHLYRDYKEEHNIKNKLKVPKFGDKFFEEHYDYAIGFGEVDHQSWGYLSGIEDLDTYLFDDNMWVIITNDNTY